MNDHDKFFAFDKFSFNFKIDNKYPKLSSAEQKAVIVSWNQVILSNPSMFNGGIYCCNGISKKGNQITFGINTSDYATYRHFRSEKINRRGTRPVGDATLILTPKGYVFAKRSNVAFDKKTYCFTSGGVVPYAETKLIQSQDFYQYVCNHADEETEEELEVQGLGKRICLGACLDTDSFSLEFAFLALAGACQMRGDENSELVYIEKGRVEEFHKDNLGKFEDSTERKLKAFARRLDTLNPDALN